MNATHQKRSVELLNGAYFILNLNVDQETLKTYFY